MAARGLGITLPTAQEAKRRGASRSKFNDLSPRQRSEILGEDVAEFLRNNGSIDKMANGESAYDASGVLKKHRPEYKRRASRARKTLEAMGHPNATKGVKRKPATKY